MITHLLYKQKFEKATWILTDENNVTTEYNSQQMEAKVVFAYVAYHNKQYSQGFYSESEIGEKNVSVRYLRLGGYVIFKHKENCSIGVNYNQIFPNYKIECYGYRYQCPDCKHLLDEINYKDEDPPEFAFCSKCLWAVSLEKPLL